MTIKRLLIALTLTLVSLLAGAGWLVATESGSRLAVRLAIGAFGERLQVSNFRGSLLGPLFIDTLRWKTPELQIAANGIELDWTPTTLATHRLRIEKLHFTTLHIDMPESPEPTARPDNLTLPVSIEARNVAVGTLHWGDSLTLRDISGQLKSDGRQHRLTEFSANAGAAAVTGSVMLDGLAPFPLQAHSEVRGQIADHPLAMSIEAAGTLERIELTASAQQGIVGEAAITLTPFAATPIAQCRLALKDIDPAAWQAGAPRARLAIEAQLQPHAGALTGNIGLTNHQPGPLDRQQLPIQRGQARIDWQVTALRLLEMTLILPGGGTLRGGARWAEETLTLDLDARRLDASRLISTLSPTRLDGPLKLTLGAERQHVRLAFRDERLSLTADAEHANDTLTVKRLELASGNARLLASGSVGTNSGKPFAISGELHQFDPSRFAKLPAAQLDARIEARGHLEPSPVIDGRFELGESRFAGQAVGGHGQLSLAWPHVAHADIALSAGPNNLTAQGSFGRPQDKLAVQVDAPRLAPVGVDGSLRGRLELTGTLEQPGIVLDLSAPRLRHATLGQLSGLSLKANLAGASDSPLLLDLTLDRVDTQGQPAFAQAVRAHVTGSNRTHRLEFAGQFAAKQTLRLAAEGGLSPERDWRGQLRELQVSSDSGPRLALRSPAPLNLGRNGWALGPAALAGESPDWQGELHATADTRHLGARVTGHGTRLGRFEGRLDAGMDGPWTLARDTAWQGRAQIDIGDLAWLGNLLGEGWQTGGHFTGEMQLAGTPAQPLSSGRLNGEQLLLRLPEQGLHLRNGELAAELDNNRLRVSRLTFASELSKPPRTLQLALGEDMARFGEPGHLDVSGELRIDRDQSAESAFLDFRLDRLGAWQQPDQWIAASGSGRLTWQDGTLGVRGNIGVDAGYWQLAPAGVPRLSDDVVIKRPGAPAPARPRPNLDFDMTADLGRRFLFNGAGLQTRLTGDLRLSAHGRDLPRASGAIRTRDGRFEAYGQQLEIERGILSFQGLLDNPALDVRALRKGLAVEAGVQIGGTAQRPTVRLVSDPELPDTDKLAWLILGHGPESMSAGDATVLVGAAGGLLGNDSGNVVQQLKKTFGIDEFGFRQGDIGGNGTRQPTSRIAGSSVDTSTTATTGNQIFSIGKRLSSNAMLSYEQSLGKAESVVKLTVNLTRQISLIGRAGSDSALDIFYTLTFGLPPRNNRTTTKPARPENP